MTVSELRDSLKIQLGYPSVKIEVADPSIEVIINVALRRFSSFSPKTVIKEFALSGNELLIDDTVESIFRIYENQSNTSSEDMFGFRPFINLSTDLSQTLVQGYINSYMESEIEGSMDFGFKKVGDKIFVDNYSGSSLMVEYLPKSLTLSNLNSSDLEWVSQYSLALLKIALGNVRRKFSVPNAPFTMDGDSLVSEGEMLRQELDAKMEGGLGFNFCITR